MVFERLLRLVLYRSRQIELTSFLRGKLDPQPELIKWICSAIIPDQNLGGNYGAIRREC